MAKGQELPFRSTLDDSDFGAKMRRMEATGKRVAANVSGQLGSLISPIAALGPAIAAAFTGRAIVSGVAQVFEAGRALRMLSRETGAGVAGLVLLQSKFKQAGLDGDLVGDSIFRLQKSIAGIEDDENRGGSGAIANLGLNLAELSHLSPDKQLLKVGDAISRIRTPAERTAKSMQIFGRAGAQLGAVFNKPGFAEFSPAAQRRAELMARNAEMFERISIKLGGAGGIFRGFYSGVADTSGKSFESLLDRLEKVDLVSAGQRFGQALANGAAALKPTLDRLEKVDWAKVGAAAGVVAEDFAKGPAHVQDMLEDDARVAAAAEKAGTGVVNFGKGLVGITAIAGEMLGLYQGQELTRSDPKMDMQAARDRFAPMVSRIADIGRAAIAAVSGEMVIAPKFKGTSLSLSSEDIALNEGRRYTGARNADAFMLNSSANWQSAHGFEGTSLVGGGLSGGGLGTGAYGRTGNIMHSMGRGGGNHLKTVAAHVQKLVSNSDRMLSMLSGGNSGGGGGGATATG